ncbi:putative aldehyde dehydrogenase [Octadecabacter antarcticus 307]|uniref:Putative aldehyde dehydrogenase n=1 Tax=Octadecabacter antarcticus 307 TaxID=391626 RepID=M9R3V1_9RHOB|nr:aldehyde dehydrogenase family protein [Octadecabacter antarcticus]AGI67329.1 putative aldehyde dehydrogenase [Octadecabacter antarcticus 307]
MDGAVMPSHLEEYDVALDALNAAKGTWAQTSIADRIALLRQVKDNVMDVAADWAETAARKKQIPDGSPVSGEEWLSGPYALMSACNGLMLTLSQMEGNAFLKHLPVRALTTGQIAVKVMPHAIWDHLLLSGVTAEVWMQKSVNAANLPDHTALAYDIPPAQRKGKVALILGAGNIASIAPLDVFQKLFLENQVVILKMNPVNDYLAEYLQVALKPLIDLDALRIVKGDGAAGAYLTTHAIIEELHITGAGSTHDAIVWGTGPMGEKNRTANTPKNDRRFTSELGAVCPTIVVPGPWSTADLKFQAEHIATHKLHNSGFNCVACQVLIMPKGWDKAETLLNNVDAEAQKSTRGAYYPGATDRLNAFKDKARNPKSVARGPAPSMVINKTSDNDWFTKNEVFAPAMSTCEIDAPDAETYLRSAIAYANDTLHGTLGANILIHPNTIREIGKEKFEGIIADLQYGTIAINAWTGLAFLLPACPWGAFPGHTPQDVQSGIGTVHNTFMLEDTERVVIQAPWRPFPRGLLSGQFTLLPRPPWFITNKKQDKVGRLLTEFQYKPSWFKIPRIFLNALLG